MWLINYLKVGLVKLADLYNRLFDPFDEFTRPACFKTPTEAFQSKEERFFKDLVDNFKALESPTTIVWNYKKTADGVLDLGDQALWHGVTTYMLCLKYSQQPTNQLEDLIVRSAHGMFLHQRAYWEPRARLVRGVGDVLGREYKDDASNDTLTGHVLGIYGLLKYGPVESRQLGVQLARGIADSLIDHNFCLTNVDGSVTRFGKLVNSYLTDAMNLGICLVTLKLASSTWNYLLPEFEQPYQDLVKKYKPILPYAHVTLGSLRHDYDAHRAAIVYSLLADLEKDHDTGKYYISGLMRSWKRERKSRNPWIYYLMRRMMLMDPTDWQGCLIRLAEMEVEEKSNVQERKNSIDEAFWKEHGVKFFQYGGNLRASQPLPLWKIGSQDFFWQRCQYSVDDWIGGNPGGQWHNGLDFLVCYWGMKSIKVLP
jgi:hypothetical protein